MCKKKSYAFVLCLCVTFMSLFGMSVNEACAQRADYSKMSRLVRKAVLETEGTAPQFAARSSSVASTDLQNRSICAFVKATDGATSSMKADGCRILAQFGDVYIVDIPLRSLASLSRNKCVERIEASQSRVATMDTTSIIIGSDKVYAGTSLPQAYTGKGVVVGSMDVGYDLTNPNFYCAEMSGTRIRRFWDQLSPDSVESNLYVGADYRTEADILRYAHSHDAQIEGHGTHTLGIAAGTGFDTPYRGVAPDADLCLVSNAVNTDLPLIPENQLYKYTSATDALGFKYIFDYAAEVGKPCVITFSEGSIQTLDADEQLFEQVISEMTGPGRILVASAGNRAYLNTYQRKPAGKLSDGVFVWSWDGKDYLSLMSSSAFDIRLTVYDAGNDKWERSYSTAQVTAAADSLLEDTVEVFGAKYMIGIEAYRAFCNPSAIVYQMRIESGSNYGLSNPVSVEAVGVDADVDIFSDGIHFGSNDKNPALGGGENTRGILSPGSFASVICVGATSYRDHLVRENGEVYRENWGSDGELAGYSSTGLTRDGLVKPDVVAPGTLVNSSFSSFYPQDNPDDGFVRQAIAHSDFNGRRYPWGGLVGTSMSTPVVAGAIALWLQADPSLTTERVMDVIAQTSRRRDGKPQGTKDNYYGYGEIDAYAGLLNVLNIDGIPGLSKSTPAALSIGLLSGNKLRVEASANVSCPESVRIDVYSLSGKKVLGADVCLSDGVADVSLSSLPAGVYAVQVSASSAAYTGSTLVRVIK